MTYTDHTANFRRFQAALICEQCHALHESCPQQLVREKLARAGYLATLTPGKPRAKG